MNFCPSISHFHKIMILNPDRHKVVVRRKPPSRVEGLTCQFLFTTLSLVLIKILCVRLSYQAPHDVTSQLINLVSQLIIEILH